MRSESPDLPKWETDALLIQFSKLYVCVYVIYICVCICNIYIYIYIYVCESGYENRSDVVGSVLHFFVSD